MLHQKPIIVWQNLQLFLKYGKWEDYTLLDLVLRRGPDGLVNWLEYPTCWYGAHKIIHFALGSISTFAFNIVLGVSMFNMAHKDEEKDEGK